MAQNTGFNADDYIRRIGDAIHARGLDSAVIVFLESSMPLVWIAGSLGRSFAMPFLFVLGDEFEGSANRFIEVFEQRENVEKLILYIEELQNRDKKTDNKKKNVDG